MIALALQIHYAIRAFRNGWRFRALVPIGVSFLISGFFGFTGGVLEDDVLSVWPLLLAVDVTTIFVLRSMANTAPADYTPDLPDATDGTFVPTPTA